MTFDRSSNPAKTLSGLCRAGLIVSAVVLPPVGPAAAQSAASSIDQPTAGTLPAGTSTVEGRGGEHDKGDGQVAPPSAIRSSTDVMQSGSSVQGKPQGGTTDPIKHLPKDMR